MNVNIMSKKLIATYLISGYPRLLIQLYTSGIKIGIGKVIFFHLLRSILFIKDAIYLNNSYNKLYSKLFSRKLILFGALIHFFLFLRRMDFHFVRISKIHFNIFGTPPPPSARFN